MKKIVIVGGGLAGFTLINEFQKTKIPADITLVEPKEYLEVPYAQLRALAQPKTFSPKIRRNYSDLLNGVNHIREKLTSVGEKSISLASGSIVDFDILILATGSSFNQWEILKGSQIDIASRQAAIEKEGAKIEKAGSILIIGGGAVGVELAGEIADRWPEKKVTIVDRGKRILGAFSEKMTVRAENLLSGLGVEVHIGSSWTKQEDGSWKDGSGNLRNYDLVLPAVGIDVNSEWAGSDVVVNERGAVKVEADLRISGRSNVFAIGDLNDVSEGKTGINAANQAKMTAKNIAALLTDEKVILKPYKPGPVVGVIPVGTKKSAVQMPFGHPHFLGALKQKDMLVSRVLGR